MSHSIDSVPDPVRPVTFVAGNSPGGIHGQSIENSSAKYSQFIDPVNPSNADTRYLTPGVDFARGGVNAFQSRAILIVAALSFIVTNFVLLRSLLQSPDAWPQGNIPAIALQYGFSLLSSTLVFTVVGSVVVIAGYAMITVVKHLQRL